MQTIVGLGEILWDVFPDGPRFGGAPANFSCSAASLAASSARVSMVSAVGDDSLGSRALQSLQDKHVDTTHVAVVQHPTGKVDVSLDEDGKASYEFASDTAWDNLPWHDDLLPLAARADAVCFGTLGQRSDCSRQTIQRFLAATRPQTLRIFDINLRPPYYNETVIQQSLQLANVLKLNDEELPILCELYECGGSDVEQLRQLSERCELKGIALTLGSQGATLLWNGQLHSADAVETEVVDTVGAGDAFTAALALGLLAEEPLAVINERATRVAAYVCSQSGATPPLPTSLHL
ncbi:Ribokinase [Roseimaritima ulvae]|uniref:Ribokinase n=2 Tax=Roseimaritima ulvae TaxID=980254 RepID=A0A5B9QNL0_9BACT|nr:Ribokinase [Roseimaritima ulvae]